MGTYHEILGQVFGEWEVIKRYGYDKSNAITWLCRCSCGKEAIVRGYLLVNGKTKSCGCKAINYIHGLSYSRIYHIWRTMLQRCYNPNNKKYKNYGARGIAITDEWSDIQSFAEWAMANGYKEDLTIDRIDNDGNYEPINCRWIALSEQAKHRRNVRVIEVNGESHTIAEWSKITGIAPGTIASRIADGWHGEDLIRPLKRRAK